MARQRLIQQPAGLNGAAEGIYSIGGGGQASIRDALELLSELAGGRLLIRYEDHQKGDVARTAASIERARRDLGFAPSTSLAEGLAEQFEWAREESRGS